MTTPTHTMISINPAELDGRQSHRLTTSIIIPRPIAWVSSISQEGNLNLAPYSFFNAVSGRPPTVMFSVGQRKGVPKDTLRNIEETKEFVVNLVDETHAALMNYTSGDFAFGQSEFEMAELEPIPSEVVRPPRVAGVPVAMEAKLTQLVPVRDSPNVMVLGQVLRFHIRQDLLLPEGIAESAKIDLVARLGGAAYSKMGEVFELQRPKV